jgi:peptidoglycan/xylan/chitin deacetylase (PgdA/CDA1 family)
MAGADPQRVARRICRGLRAGASVLMHDAAEGEDFEPAAPEVLPKVLEELTARGLSTVRVSEFMPEELVH